MEILNKFGWRWLMMVVAMVAMGVSMAACGDDDDEDGGDGNDGSAYVGVWALADDMDDSDPGYIFAVEIKADGTGRDGRWDADANEFVSNEDYWQWRVDGDMFYLTQDGETHSTRFTLSDDGRSGTMGGERYVKVR